MSENAQELPEGIQKRKVKRAAVPDLSIFGIPAVGTAPSIDPAATGANAPAKPVKAASARALQSSFFYRRRESDPPRPGRASDGAERGFAAGLQCGDRFISAAELGRTPPKEGALRVAAYIRVSNDSEDQENSYEMQSWYFASLLQRNPDWTSAGVYSDCGLSGTNKEHRTGYKRLLRHCREGKVDRIVCKSISRFARNTSDFMAALEFLHEHHVTILFEKENLDTQDAASDFILTTLAAIAQEESRSISANIRWSNQKRFPMGHVCNVALYGYRYAEGDGGFETLEGGYRIRRIEIVDEEAEVVRYVFSEVCEGRAFADIARTLNARRIPAPNEGRMRGKVKAGAECGWTGAIISEMVARERYCGDVLIQKTYTPDFLTHRSVRNDGRAPQYMVRNHHPAIIGRELFEGAQAVRRHNSEKFRNKAGVRNRHAFSGRLTCAHCGRHYNVRNAGFYPIWYCPASMLNNGKHVCRAERIYEEQVVRMFRKAFVGRFELAAEPVPDDVTVADVMSGRYGQDGDALCSFTRRADDFVPRVRVLLENVQRADNMERDRSFLKRRISARRAAAAEAEKRIRWLDAQRRALEGESGSPGDAVAVNERLAMESARLRDAQREADELDRRLADLEDYWDRLEADHEERERALEWMKTLPAGCEGAAAFLNGLTGEYVRAFALSIAVRDPLHYAIRWFDDVRTEVEMCSNVGDHRCTGDYFDGQRMRPKRRRGR